MDYYRTENLDFAAFLRAEGIDLRELEKCPDNPKRCLFVFRIDKSDPKLLDCISAWDSSPEAQGIKRVLYQEHVLRKELIAFLIKNNGR